MKMIEKIVIAIFIGLFGWSGVAMANDGSFLGEFGKADLILLGEVIEESSSNSFEVDVRKVWKGESNEEENITIVDNDPLDIDTMYVFAFDIDNEQSKGILKIPVERKNGILGLGENNLGLFLSDQDIATLSYYLSKEGEVNFDQFSEDGGKVMFKDKAGLEYQIYPTKKDYLAVIVIIGMVVVLLGSGLNAVWISMQVKPIDKD